MKVILYWLFFAGLLRGIFETIWLYLMKGQFHQIVSSVGDMNWYLFNIGPFIVSNISSSYFLWTLTALIVYATGKFLDGKAVFVDVLRIYGVAMFSYFLIGILNYIHYFINISMIRFKASEIFNPDLGIGQIAIFIWLAILTYEISRNMHRLSNMESLLIALLPILVGLVLYIFSIIIFFDIILNLLNLYSQPFFYSLIIYIISNIFLTFLFLFIGYNLK